MLRARPASNRKSAGLANARAQLLRARADMARADDLVRDGSISIRERDQTAAALRQAEAGVQQAIASGDIAQQDLRTVDVGRDGLVAQVKAAEAQLHLAQIDLGNTIVRAPESGQIGEVGVRLGQYVTNGVQLLALVPVDRWIIANYKERQASGIAPGQPRAIHGRRAGWQGIHGSRRTHFAGGRLGVRRAQARQRDREFREGAATHRHPHRDRSGAGRV